MLITKNDAAGNAYLLVDYPIADVKEEEVEGGGFLDRRARRAKAIASVKARFPYREMSHILTCVNTRDNRPATPDPREGIVRKRPWEKDFMDWKISVLNCSYITGPMYLRMTTEGVEYDV